MKEKSEIEERIKRLKNKFEKKEVLSLLEIEDLGLHFQLEDEKDKLKDSKFDFFNFKQIFFKYAFDLDFKSEYYKKNPNKNLCEYLDPFKLKVLSEQEHNPQTLDNINEYLIENNVLVKILPHEIEIDKIRLKNIAKDWALICINERHSDEKFRIIAKETRDDLVLKNIQNYSLDNLPLDQEKNIFKGLIKSYYIFHEAQKILEKIDNNNEPKKFTINKSTAEINFYSLIHILYRHYFETISSQNIIHTKSFHNPKIIPENINLFVSKLFRLIKENKLEEFIKLESKEGILVKYFENDYGLFFDNYVIDKSKLVLKTFFVIDQTNSSASGIVERIRMSKREKLDYDLSIYLKK